MSSINLLPKSFNFDDEEKEESENRFAILVSLVIILIPMILYTVLHFNNINSSEEITVLNSKIEAIDKEIEKRIEDNKLLILEDKAADANNLLVDHPYFTKLINLINKNLIDDLYLTSMLINFDRQEFITVELNAIAKRNSTIASQILVFKNMTEVKSVNMESTAPTEEGYAGFDLNLEIEKQVIFYKELSEEEKLIKGCKEIKEEIKNYNSTIKIGIEDSCYLVEAMRIAAKTGKTNICKETKTNYGRCSCNAMVNFLSEKSKEEKEEIISKLGDSYYEANKLIFADPTLKEVIDSFCVMKNEEIIEWCNDNKNELEKENCYLLSAIDNERKFVCGEIENSCHECSCNALIDYLSTKSDEEKEEIIGDREGSAQQIVEGIFKKDEIINTVNNLCEHACQN